MTEKPTVTRETFDSLNQKGRDGVLFDLGVATFSKVEKLDERVCTLENKTAVDTKEARKAGAQAGLLGGIIAVATFLFGKTIVPW